MAGRAAGQYRVGLDRVSVGETGAQSVRRIVFFAVVLLSAASVAEIVTRAFSLRPFFSAALTARLAFLASLSFTVVRTFALRSRLTVLKRNVLLAPGTLTVPRTITMPFSLRMIPTASLST